MPPTAVQATDSTAVCIAVWRARHIEAEPPLHVFEDVIGARLALDEMLMLAREAGSRMVQHVSVAMRAERSFADRTDGLRLLRNSKEHLVALT
jgi:hypothetical protein